MSRRKERGRRNVQVLPLPLGATLRHTLRDPSGCSGRVAWSPDGRLLASGAVSGAVSIWDAQTGQLVNRFGEGALPRVNSVAWSHDGDIATGHENGTIAIWEVRSGDLITTLPEHGEPVTDVAWSPKDERLASTGMDGYIRIWNREESESKTFRRYHRKEKRERPVQLSVAWSPDAHKIISSSYELCVWDAETGELQNVPSGAGGLYDAAWLPGAHSQTVAAASSRGAVLIFDVNGRRPLIELEGHTEHVRSVAFTPDGSTLASSGGDIRLWDCKTWKPIAVLPARSPVGSLVFNPKLPMLAFSGPGYNFRSEQDPESAVDIWELDLDVLRGHAAAVHATAVRHTTAKIVLVGDSGVGKTGLGWRLAHGEFKEHSSTHGQQFWVLDSLSTRRPDGTQCEAILWDLAGQPDYRLTHALFLDDADLALVLFDPTDARDPLHGVEFWLRQLGGSQEASPSASSTNEESGPSLCPTILVGARVDRGEARLTQQEIESFCRARGIAGGYLASSAKEGRGLPKLLQTMRKLVPWDRKTTAITTVTFKRIKDYVLELKENRRRKKVLVTPQDLRKRLQKTDSRWRFTDQEMMTAVRHLGNYGYVRVLKTSKGEDRVLLVPELLNNLAASLVIEARRNPKGLGSLEETRLLRRRYSFRELDRISDEEQEILLDAAALLFLKHNVCLRETDPLTSLSYLVFPELINLKKPILKEEHRVEDDVSYTAIGAAQNVYASLVVLLGYTQTFTRTDQWRSQARYEVGDGLICGFRQESEHEGELDLVLYFGTNVGAPVRSLFKGLFESFLARRNLTVFRYEPVRCSQGHALNRSVVREQSRSGSDFAFCPKCGEKLAITAADEPIQLTQAERGKVSEQQWFAARRSRFEQSVFQLSSYVESQKLHRASCFVSYAWGDKEHERWVERDLATDLRKAGINVILDRWENARVGASVPRFVEQIEKSDRIVVVGTPLYRKKYENKDTATGYVVAAEVDMISNRLLGTEAQKESVLPILLSGEKATSLPPLMHSRVFGDFRNERDYFNSVFALILSLYRVAVTDPVMARLRESIQETQVL